MINRRGSRLIGNDDLIFQIRHNSARVARLQSFITWKAARKSFKDDDAAEGVEEAEVEELPDEVQAEKPKMPTTALLWDVTSFYSHQTPDTDQAEDPDAEVNDAALERLRINDERTKHMTATEYAIFSEYRHASFTWRKAKRFREWSGLGTIATHKKNEDVLEILGFLTSEMVQNLTMAALQLQKQELGQVSAPDPRDTTDRKTSLGLFTTQVPTRTPIDGRHVREAFRRMQRTPNKRRAMLNGTRVRQQSELRLVSPHTLSAIYVDIILIIP